jgi:hypothetical protein
MATQKGGKPDKKSGNMDWGNPVHSSVDVGRSDPNKDEPHVSVIVILCLAIMALTFVVAIPLIGIALMDSHNATTVAVEEIKKMRELRLKMMLMMQGD